LGIPGHRHRCWADRVQTICGKFDAETSEGACLRGRDDLHDSSVDIVLVRVPASVYPLAHSLQFIQPCSALYRQYSNHNAFALDLPIDGIPFFPEPHAHTFASPSRMVLCINCQSLRNIVASCEVHPFFVYPVVSTYYCSLAAGQPC